jgi:hypothetical protein
MLQKHITLLLAAVLFATLSASAQVRINEYSAANWKQFLDNYNAHEDWIELYNTASAPANVGGFWITDDADKPQKFQLPAGTVMEANGYLIIWCSGRDKAENGVIHANFKLTQTKNNAETLVLSNAQGNKIDEVTVQKTTTHQSRCRATNGGTEWKICTAPTLGTSNNGSPQFDGFADRPTMDKTAGFYAGAVTVAVETTEPNGVIRFTTDGTEPRANSEIYTTPLIFTETTVFKARVFSPNPAILPGFVRFNTYFIDEDFTMPVMSIAADSLQDLANGEKEIRPIGSFEFFETDKTRQATSYGELNSHGQDSWVNDHRSLDWVSRDEMGYSKAVQYPLFTYTERDEYQRFILRASGDDNYPATTDPVHEGACHLRDDYCQTLAKLGGLNLDVRASERCIVFLNGDYWGVYSIREKPDDHDYTEYHYNQGKYDLQVLNTWADTEAEYGGENAHADWKQLREFILSNDMGLPANYKVASDSIDLLSMVDYFLVNLNVVASDWLNYNTGWWRGLNPDGGHQKWGYNLWDLDATFDYYINYSEVPNTEFDAVPCDLETISTALDENFFIFVDTCFVFNEPGFPTDTFCFRVDGKHHQIILKLIEENDDFKQLYYSRQADLINTVFSCENMLFVFDSMVAVIAPEMPRQIQRWGGTLSEWQANVQTMRNYISNRCAFFSEGMTCFDGITDAQPITLLVQPPGAGEIDFNTLTHANFPWTGEYFGGMDQKITARATGTINFHHWETRQGNIIAAPLSASTTYTISQPDTLVAVFSNNVATDDLTDGTRFELYPTLIENGQVLVNYELPTAQSASLTLHSTLGQQIANWQFEPRTTQNTVLNLQEKNLTPGVYFLTWQAGQQRVVRKLTLVR